jgi:hypothetical protein
MKIRDIIREDVIPFPGATPATSAPVVDTGNIDWFARGYMNAAVMDWYENRRNPDRSWQWSDASKVRSLDLDDVDQPMLNQMLRDCQAFQKKNARFLRGLKMASEFAGRNFYHARNGGGDSTWQKLAAPFGPATPLYMGQDLKLHAMPNLVK